MPSGGRARRLRVGPLEATWDGGGLRWIRVDGVEVLRGILLTARDADWRTQQPVIRGLVVTKGTEAFSIDFEARFRGEGLAVDARVAYRGDAAGRIEARFDGRVVADSVVQRLGLVVLHPASAAGRPFEATDATGTSRGAFPVLVTAERFMTEVRAMRWEAADGLRASLAFESEPWETEDQRAWTDASFKSYSPPLSRPHPVTLAAGATVETAIRLELAPTTERTAASAKTAPRSRRPSTERVAVGDQTRGALPAIGLGWSEALRADEAARLRTLGPAHLRLVVDWTRDDWRAELQAAARDAAAIGASLQLELVGFASGDARDAIVEVLAGIEVPLAGALAFGTTADAGIVTSVASAVDALRDRLQAVAPGIEIGGGARTNCAELAGASVPIDLLDALAFAVTPQIHATDAATIIENLATLPVVIESAAVHGRSRLDVLASFRPRFDAYADPPERRLSPTRFDDRLADPLGSAWLVGTLAGVLTGEVARVTILEASGPAGVLRSTALLEIYEAVISMRGGEVVRVETSDGCVALAIRSGARLRVIVANLRDRAIALECALPPGWHALDRAAGRLDLGPYGHAVLAAVPD